MGKIKVETCEIEGLKVITPAVFGDERGYFMETYNYNDYKEAGIDMEFVQDNQSSSEKGSTPWAPFPDQLSAGQACSRGKRRSL